MFKMCQILNVNHIIFKMCQIAILSAILIALILFVKFFHDGTPHMHVIMKLQNIVST